MAPCTLVDARPLSVLSYVTSLLGKKVSAATLTLPAMQRPSANINILFFRIFSFSLSFDFTPSYLRFIIAYFCPIRTKIIVLIEILFN